MATRRIKDREVASVVVGQGGTFGGLGDYPCSVELRLVRGSCWLSPRDARELAHALIEASRELDAALGKK